jgi:protein-S-isoprenylcysteine O-methyltransferase Ste14
MMVTLVRALAYATVFVGVTGIFLPSRVLRAAGVSPPHDTGAPQIAGMIVGAAGATLGLWCLLAFVIVGKGTPMPLDPPERLVVRGPYRFVRNPMYIGAGFALGGAALYFTSMWLLAYGVALAAAAHAFVVLYEERVLSDKFGHDYDAYRRQAGRWIPRL